MRVLSYIILAIGIIISLSINKVKNENCIAVGPGGFSGFWHSYAVLSNLNYTGEYLCASSGCLSIVSKDIPFNTLYNIAKYSNKNTLSDTRRFFIDNLVKKIDVIPDIKIVTMNKYASCLFRKPKNKKELRTLLYVTTDVPFIFDGSSNEFDGFICYYIMNRCKKTINMPIKYRFVKKILSSNINPKDLEYFYNYR
jgi:hypothetical protein